MKYYVSVSEWNKRTDCIEEYAGLYATDETLEKKLDEVKRTFEIDHSYSSMKKLKSAFIDIYRIIDEEEDEEEDDPCRTIDIIYDFEAGKFSYEER